MRPMRTSFRPVLPSVRNLSTVLAVGLVVGSVVYGILLQTGSPLQVILIPASVWPVRFAGELMPRFPYQLWQVVTYAFVEVSAMGVIFGALALWSLGGALEAQWGPRRFFLFTVGLTVAAGILTVLLSLAMPGLHEVPFRGGWAMVGVVWVAYGLSHGRAETSFWGMPVSGNVFALMGVGFVVLTALLERNNWILVVPDAFAIALTYAALRLSAPRMAWLRFQNWRLQRKLRGRAKHLRLITKDRNTPSDSDRYLH